MPAQRSSGTASLPTAPRMDRAPVEIKPQKACVNCRRSKVKCVHEGGPPCKRCTNNKVECKFRLRADDEDWRDWTDDRINTLNNKVDQIISRGSSMGPTPTPGPPSPSFSHLSRSMSIGGSGSSLNLPPIGSMTQQGGNGLPPPSSWSNSQAPTSRGVTTMRAPSARGAMEAPSPQMNSPQSMLPHRPRSSTGGSSSAPAPPLPQPYGVATNTAASPRSSNATFIPFPHAHQSTAQTYGSPQLRPPTHFPSHPNAITNGNQQGGDTSMERGGEEGGPSGAEGSDHKSPASARSNEDSRMRTGDDNHHAGPPPPSEIFASQIPSPPLLSQLFALSSPSRPLVLPPRATSHRWATGKGTYANANMLIGREDPRLNAISMGIVPMARARALMVFFADHLQPHSFGFPSFPANEQMTPLIISSLLMVASAHEPSSTHFYSPLLAEVLSSVKPEEEVSEEKPLDPELGIGVEEITGACIAASWMGGENGWKIARVARWWAIGYLSNFDLPNPRSVTLGECLQILPTFRSIDQVDKMRIWLMAYCTEAQQAYMHDRPVLTPGVSPDPYIQALRAAFAEGRVIDSQTGLEHHNSPRGAGSSIGKVPEADRMLTAHAGLMFILTSARSRLREMRWRWGREREREREREIAGHHPLGVEELRATQIAEGDELRNAWKSWIAELDIFWIDAGVWEDLSAPTTSALDLSLCNHLVRALLGSLALDFPEPNHQHGRSHSHPLSPAVGGGGGPSPSGSGGYVHESPHSHPTPGGSGANHQNSGPFLHARAPSHVSFSAHPNPNMSPTLQLAQVEMVRTGKDAAVRALRAVCGNGEFRGEWRERLGWLPGWYHFLLAHSASFLLILLHRRSTFLSAGEVDSIYTLMSNFTQLYLFAIQSHSIVGSETESGPHPALVTAEGLVRGMRGIVPSLNE